jgi:hypothetical protein
MTSRKRSEIAVRVSRSLPTFSAMASCSGVRTGLAPSSGLGLSAFAFSISAFRLKDSSSAAERSATAPCSNFSQPDISVLSSVLVSGCMRKPSSSDETIGLPVVTGSGLGSDAASSSLTAVFTSSCDTLGGSPPPPGLSTCALAGLSWISAMNSARNITLTAARMGCGVADFRDKAGVMAAVGIGRCTAFLLAAIAWCRRGRLSQGRRCGQGDMCVMSSRGVDGHKTGKRTRWMRLFPSAFGSLGSGGRDRTYDQLINSQLLYR